MIQNQSAILKERASEMQRRTRTGFGRSRERFGIDYSQHGGDLMNTKGDSGKIGPGSYNDDKQFKKLNNATCSVQYKHLTIGKEEAATGNYHLENGRLIYEPNYCDPRKKERDNLQSMINKILTERSKSKK